MQKLLKVNSSRFWSSTWSKCLRWKSSTRIRLLLLLLLLKIYSFLDSSFRSTGWIVLPLLFWVQHAYMTYICSHCVWLPVYAYPLCTYVCDVTIFSLCDWSHDLDSVEEGTSRHVKFRSLRVYACQKGTIQQDFSIYNKTSIYATRRPYIQHYFNKYNKIPIYTASFHYIQ